MSLLYTRSTWVTRLDTALSVKHPVCDHVVGRRPLQHQNVSESAPRSSNVASCPALLRLPDRLPVLVVTWIYAPLLSAISVHCLRKKSPTNGKGWLTMQCVVGGTAVRYSPIIQPNMRDVRRKHDGEHGGKFDVGRNTPEHLFSALSRTKTRDSKNVYP